MINLDTFENPAKNIYVLKKWNWDYREAEEFQLKCVDYVYQNPHISIFIICSHPSCFTIGRGLQKIKETTKQVLIDYNHETVLPYPLHSIKRGGGITFHYEGQFVLYPILSLTHHKLAVHDLMISIMEITKILIEKQYGLNGLNINKDLLGLWFENIFAKAKVASIGLAVKRFITYHGMAFNYFSDDKMFDSLKAIYPCGLPGDIYRDLELLLGFKLEKSDRDFFADNFIDSMISLINQDQLIIERQRSSSLINDSISLVEN